MRPAMLGLALAAIFLLAPQSAIAQYGGTYMGRADNPVGPTVSPYLNLLQNNGFGVTNYQSLVKPLINQGNAIQQQGHSIGNLQRQVSQQAYGAGGTRRGTGHATYFMNYGHYYMNYGQYYPYGGR
ncbi:MAG: hypothetical protein WD063_21810 [Pirellulales bacterium]